jgi:hypothetical protein
MWLPNCTQIFFPVSLNPKLKNFENVDAAYDLTTQASLTLAKFNPYRISPSFLLPRNIHPNRHGVYCC